MYINKQKISKIYLNRVSIDSAYYNRQQQFIKEYNIGDVLGGGLVAEVLGNNQYKIVSVELFNDASSQYIIWGDTANETFGRSFTDGITNTDAMLATDPLSETAATISRAYNGGGFNDWYLPAIDELEPLYQNRVILGLNSNFYWSSTESSTTFAYVKSFGNGSNAISQKSSANNVRAVRIHTI